MLDVNKKKQQWQQLKDITLVVDWQVADWP